MGPVGPLWENKSFFLIPKNPRINRKNLTKSNHFGLINGKHRCINMWFGWPNLRKKYWKVFKNIKINRKKNPQAIWDWSLGNIIYKLQGIFKCFMKKKRVKGAKKEEERVENLLCSSSYRLLCMWAVLFQKSIPASADMADNAVAMLHSSCYFKPWVEHTNCFAKSSNCLQFMLQKSY